MGQDFLEVEIGTVSDGDDQAYIGDSSSSDSEEEEDTEEEVHPIQAGEVAKDIRYIFTNESKQELLSLEIPQIVVCENTTPCNLSSILITLPNQDELNVALDNNLENIHTSCEVEGLEFTNFMKKLEVEFEPKLVTT